MTLTATVTLVKGDEKKVISKTVIEVDKSIKPWYSEHVLTESSYVVNEGVIK